MNVLFIRAPRLVISEQEQSNILPPLNFAYLASVLRQNNIKVEIIDCVAQKIGWRSTRKLLEKNNFDVICIGDEALYAHEGIKAVKIAKENDSEIIAIGGGAHHSNAPEHGLNNGVDFVVKHEGEYTLLELIKYLDGLGKKPLKKISGIAFKTKEKKIFETKPRPLIKNLDELPMPAYDLLHLENYGKGLIFHNGAAVECSRGCIGSCPFCVCWLQMAQHKKINGKTKHIPFYRIKSVEKVIDEIEYLRKKFKRESIFFTDNTWNINPSWCNKFCDEVINKDLKFDWFAFLRADFIVRDGKSGLLKKMSKAGLRNLLVGVERIDDDEIRGKYINKPNCSYNTTKKAFKLLKRDCAESFKIASYTLGLRNETRDSIIRILEHSLHIGADFASFLMYTPWPNTDLWREAKKNGWIEAENFCEYDLIYPIMPSKYLSRQEIHEIYLEMHKKWVVKRLPWLLIGLFNKEKSKRARFWHLFLAGIGMAFKTISSRDNLTSQVFYRKPRWYDS